MSEHPTFDRAKGFVALPVAVLEIDLTPGAFRLLVELCRMANADGYCWPSLEQLSDRIGRSKPAISGYVKELRDAELVTTQTQKTANGYNYRLKYRVTFWQDWRASLRGTTTQKNERDVQQAERLEESKKQNPKKHLLPQAGFCIDQLIKNWADCFKGAPYPLTSKKPSSELLMNTYHALNAPAPALIISADIQAALTDLWAKFSVEIGTKTLQEQTEHILDQGHTTEEFSNVLRGLKRAWKMHWKRPPTAEQFATLVKANGGNTTKHRFDLLRSYQQRWQIAESCLPSNPKFDCLVAKQRVST